MNHLTVSAQVEAKVNPLSFSSATSSLADLENRSNLKEIQPDQPTNTLQQSPLIPITDKNPEFQYQTPDSKNLQIHPSHPKFHT